MSDDERVLHPRNEAKRGARPDPNCGFISGTICGAPERVDFRSGKHGARILVKSLRAWGDTPKEMKIPFMSFGRNADALLDYAEDGDPITIQYSLGGNEYVSRTTGKTHYAADAVIDVFTWQGKKELRRDHIPARPIVVDTEQDKLDADDDIPF